VVWGNTVATGVKPPKAGSKGTPVTVTLFGRITPGQDVSVGAYGDTVGSTVDF